MKPLEAKVKVTREGVLIPKELFKEMMSIHTKMEQLLATIELLADDEALKTIKKSKKQVSNGDCIECSVNELFKEIDEQNKGKKKPTEKEILKEIQTYRREKRAKTRS